MSIIDHIPLCQSASGCLLKLELVRSIRLIKLINIVRRFSASLVLAPVSDLHIIIAGPIRCGGLGNRRIRSLILLEITLHHATVSSCSCSLIACLKRLLLNQQLPAIGIRCVQIFPRIPTSVSFLILKCQIRITGSGFPDLIYQFGTFLPRQKICGMILIDSGIVRCHRGLSVHQIAQCPGTNLIALRLIAVPLVGSITRYDVQNHKRVVIPGMPLYDLLCSGKRFLRICFDRLHLVKDSYCTKCHRQNRRCNYGSNPSILFFLLLVMPFHTHV